MLHIWEASARPEIEKTDAFYKDYPDSAGAWKEPVNLREEEHDHWAPGTSSQAMEDFLWGTPAHSQGLAGW